MTAQHLASKGRRKSNFKLLYYNNRATGGGAVQDAMTHLLNIGEWIVGPVDKLVADIDHKVLEGVEVERHRPSAYAARQCDGILYTQPASSTL